MRNWFCLVVSLALCASAAAGARRRCGAPPARVEIEFELMRNGSTMAEVVERLEHANGNYVLTETWKGKGIYALLGRAKRVSAGTLGADGPRPTEYMDERSGRDTQRVFIDWKANTITRRYKGKTSTEPVPADTQDRLSFLLALAFASRNGQPVTFHVVDGRGMSHHTYQPAGREKLGDAGRRIRRDQDDAA